MSTSTAPENAYATTEEIVGLITTFHSRRYVHIPPIQPNELHYVSVRQAVRCAEILSRQTRRAVTFIRRVIIAVCHAHLITRAIVDVKVGKSLRGRIEITLSMARGSPDVDESGFLDVVRRSLATLSRGDPGSQRVDIVWPDFKVMYWMDMAGHDIFSRGELVRLGVFGRLTM